jgi:hypothetical protein
MREDVGMEEETKRDLESDQERKEKREETVERERNGNCR